MQSAITIASLALLSFLPISSTTQPVSSGSQPIAQEDEKSPLADAMGVLKHGQRSLKKAIKDPVANKAGILETLSAMEGATLRALALQPPLPEGMTESQSPLFQVRYRIQMTALLNTLLEMEQASLKDEGAKLPELYKALTAGKKGGHREFKED